MVIGNRVLAQSGDMGALPTLYAATQDIPGDTYIGPNGPGEMRGYPGIANRSAAAQDAERGGAAVGGVRAADRCELSERDVSFGALAHRLSRTA